MRGDVTLTNYPLHNILKKSVIVNLINELNITLI